MQEHWKQTPCILRSWTKAFGTGKLKHLQALYSPPLFHTQAHVFLHAPISTKLGSPALCYCREAPQNAGDANSAWQLLAWPKAGSPAAKLHDTMLSLLGHPGSGLTSRRVIIPRRSRATGCSTKKIAGELAQVAQATAKQQDEKCRVAQQQQGESQCHAEPGSQHTLATQKSPQ